MTETREEAWRELPGHPGYRVSDLGRVIGPSGRILRPGRDRKGYLGFTAYPKRFKVHAAVLLAFRGERPLGAHGAHLNGDSGDNRLENLAWLTPTENERQKREHGTVAAGERNGRTKLTAAQVEEIKRDCRAHSRGMGFSAFARKFGVHNTTVRDAYHGNSWSALANEASHHG